MEKNCKIDQICQMLLFIFSVLGFLLYKHSYWFIGVYSTLAIQIPDPILSDSLFDFTHSRCSYGAS